MSFEVGCAAPQADAEGCWIERVQTWPKGANMRSRAGSSTLCGRLATYSLESSLSCRPGRGPRSKPPGPPMPGLGGPSDRMRTTSALPSTLCRSHMAASQWTCYMKNVPHQRVQLLVRDERNILQLGQVYAMLPQQFTIPHQKASSMALTQTWTV